MSRSPLGVVSFVVGLLLAVGCYNFGDAQHECERQGRCGSDAATSQDGDAVGVDGDQTSNAGSNTAAACFFKR